VLLTWCTFCFN